MADVVGYFPATLAVDSSTGTRLRNAKAKIYAITDTTFSNPLDITDLADVPFTGAELISNSDGIFPEFKTPLGVTQVLLRSGQALTPMTSVAASAGAALEAAEAASQAASAATNASMSATAAVEMAEEARQEALAAAAAAAAVGATTDTQMTAVQGNPQSLFAQDQQLRIGTSIATAEAKVRGKTLLAKSALAYTPNGWSRKDKGVSPIAALASTTGYLTSPVLLLNRAFTQSLAANTMSGGTVGSLESGGAGVLPLGWSEFQPNAKKTITEVGSGVLEIKLLNVWSGTYGGVYASGQSYTAGQTIGVDLAIYDVPPTTQIQVLFAWRRISDGTITNTVGQTGANGGDTAAPFVSSMPKTRISVELAAPAAASNLLIMVSPVVGDSTTGVQPRLRIEKIGVVSPFEIGSRPELIPPFLPAGTYPASDAVVSLPNGDYALVAVTADGMFIPKSVTVSNGVSGGNGSLSLQTAIGGVGRYSHLYLVPSEDYRPEDLAAFLPLSTRSGLATQPRKSPDEVLHSRGIMHLSALAMGKRSSTYVSGVNGGSLDRAVQIATGARRARFEVHLGERDPDDGPGQNRAELSHWQVYPHGQAFGWAGWINFESLPWDTSGNPDQEKYCLVLQFRYAASPDPGASPEVALEGLGVDQAGKFRMRLLTRSGTAAVDPKPPVVNRYDAIHPLGWEYVGLSVLEDPAGNGSCQMWINPTGKKNGHQLVVDSGPIALGYANSTGFRVRQGAYANNWDMTRIIEHESTEFGLGLDVLSRVMQPPPRLVT